jgi:hypothetical protein
LCMFLISRGDGITLIARAARTVPWKERSCV